MFFVMMTDFSGETCGLCTIERIADAVTIARASGYTCDIVDASTGEVLLTCTGDVTTYSIFE